MLSLGFMTLDLQHEQVYFSEIARNASDYQIICYRFVPSKINPLTEMVEGEVFNCETNDWIKSHFPLPNILYDRCFYKDDFHSKQCKGIVNWLKTKESIQFLGIGLPNKLMIYETLSKSKLAPYLPSTIQVHSPEIALHYLYKWNQIILKPIDGSQGNGIYRMEKQNQQIMVRTDKVEKQVARLFVDESDWLTWMHRLMSKREFMLQPFLPLYNENRQPFDIRSLLQKDQDGDWTLVGTGIRQGQEDGIVSNLSVGGTIIAFELWQNSLPPQKRNFVTDEIKEILKELPTIMEKQFPPLFELGVDIGMAKDYSLWILDINSKPGRKVLLMNRPELKEYLSKSPLLYAKLLQERRAPTLEKTLFD